MRRVTPLKRAALAVASVLTLTACEGATGLLGGADDTPEKAQRSAAFFDGEVVVAGPPGYCIDPSSVRRKAASGFALLAGCGHLSDAPAGAVPPAVITVSILPYDAEAAPPTAGQLARPWEGVGVTRQVDDDGLAMIQVAGGGDRLLPEGDPRHWRGAMLIDGHLIGLAVYGEAGEHVAGEAGKALLSETAAAMRKAAAGG